MGWALFCDLTGKDMTSDNESYELILESVDANGKRKPARPKMNLHGVAVDRVLKAIQAIGVDFAREQEEEAMKVRMN